MIRSTAMERAQAIEGPTGSCLVAQSQYLSDFGVDPQWCWKADRNTDNEFDGISYQNPTSRGAA
jgi:hypothetical protein